MTDGSSQGLFVIVAVVIFGIFIVISYLLFRDKLQTGLASIFTDSINKSQDNLLGLSEIDFKMIKYFSVITEVDDNHYIINWSGVESTDTFWGENLIIGVGMNKQITVPYGYKLTVFYDILSPIDAETNVDINQVADGTNYNGSGNDLEGSRSQPTEYQVPLKANTWTTASYWYTNDNSKNKDKINLIEYSYFGIPVRYVREMYNNNQTYQIKNIRYKIEKI